GAGRATPASGEAPPLQVPAARAGSAGRSAASPSIAAVPAPPLARSRDAEALTSPPGSDSDEAHHTTEQFLDHSPVFSGSARAERRDDRRPRLRTPAAQTIVMLARERELEACGVPHGQRPMLRAHLLALTG